MKQIEPMPPENTTPDTLKTPERTNPEEPGTAFEPAIEAMDERVWSALRAASDKKALDVVALDLRPLASFTDYFLITSGTNTRQVQAIADEVVERLKKEGTRAARVEGYKTAEWVLLDYGDFIFHIFEARARSFFDLERLWRDATRVPVTPEMLEAASADGASENV